MVTLNIYSHYLLFNIVRDHLANLFMSLCLCSLENPDGHPKVTIYFVANIVLLDVR